MRIKQLKPFCSTDDTRPALEQPFSRDEWTFATNGYICVRVPRLAEVGEVEHAPDCVKLFKQENFDDPERRWVEPPEPIIEIKQCGFCDGKKFTYYDRKLCELIPVDETHPKGEKCEECGGAGEHRSGYMMLEGPKGETKLASIYIELCRTLPNCKIGLLGNESDGERPKKKPSWGPVCFRFDGGDGLLMPVRK